MSKIGANNPPDVVLELTDSEATFLFDALDAEMEMGLKLLMGVQAGTFRKEVAEKVVKKMDAVRPIRDKLRKALK